MACLINSLDELPKIVEMDWPTTEEDWIEFAQNYVCVANGQEVAFDEVVFDPDRVTIYYSTIPGGDDFVEIVITSGGGPDPKGLKKSSDEKGINVGVFAGIFDPLTSLTLCEKSSGGKTICGTPVCDEGKEPFVITPTSTKIGNEYAGTSDKQKPVNVPQYSIYLELDTGKFYYYDNGEWNEIPCCGSVEPEDNRPYIILTNGISPEDVLVATAPDSLPVSISDLVIEGDIEFKDGKYYIDADGAEALYFWPGSPENCYFIMEYGPVTGSSSVEVPISPSLEIVISYCNE